MIITQATKYLSELRKKEYKKTVQIQKLNSKQNWIYATRRLLASTDIK